MPRQRKPPKNTYRIQFDVAIERARVKEALAAAGIELKVNPESFELFAVEAKKQETK